MPAIVITGPTASGKTGLAVRLCRSIGGEVISADSRQVYRRMDIGTGKDMGEYGQGKTAVPVHLIDICEPGDKYNVFRFQEDALQAAMAVRKRGRVPVICGGTGLYIEALLKSFQYTPVPAHPLPLRPEFQEDFTCFLVDIPREIRRQRITERLHLRLEQGLIREVEGLLRDVSPDDLIYYGLEYKYVTLHLTGKLTEAEMSSRLETEIHRYAKRQMTWFRKMERQGIILHRIDGMLPVDEQVNAILRQLG